MANFLARALRYLGSAYEIRGSEVSTNQVDLSSVQLVHDVAPMLASGRAIGFHDGYLVARLGIEVDDGAAPATPQVVGQFNPYTSGDRAIGPWPEEIPESHDLWCYGVGASTRVFVTNSEATQIAPFLRLPTDLIGAREQVSSTAIGVWFSLGRFLTASLNTEVNSARMRIMDGDSLPNLSYPFRIPRTDVYPTLGAIALFDLPGTDDGTKAIEVFVDFFLRAVPRGIYPGP